MIVKENEIQANSSEQPSPDERGTNNLADLPVTTENETQLTGGQRPWTLHKAVDNL